MRASLGATSSLSKVTAASVTSNAQSLNLSWRAGHDLSPTDFGRLPIVEICVLRQLGHRLLEFSSS